MLGKSVTAGSQWQAQHRSDLLALHLSLLLYNTHNIDYIVRAQHRSDLLALHLSLLLYNTHKKDYIVRAQHRSGLPDLQVDTVNGGLADVKQYLIKQSNPKML